MNFREVKLIVGGIRSILLMMREQLVTHDLQREMADRNDRISVGERRERVVLEQEGA